MELAERHPGWGYRRMQGYLNDLGVKMGPKRVYRLYQAPRVLRELASRLGAPRQLHVAGELAFVRETGVFSRAYLVPVYRVQDHVQDLEARVAQHRGRHRNDIAASFGVTLWK